MHSSSDRIPQFCTILSSFVFIALSDWTPDLRVAIVPLEPHSSAGNYGTYAVESANGSSSTSDHHHHHYSRHPKHLATNAGADADDLFCLTEENRAYWTPLEEWSECSDSCGGCGIRWRPRKCRRRHIQCDCLG
uniref:Thrombospondin type 1 domain protein n=1 Tax=Globodera pallida TaxID=36090 RepID=A0A183CSZ0_GLOPA